MGTEIRTWQIADGKLKEINTKLQDTGRTEPYDLEPWIYSNPEILGSDILIIGRQVTSKSGPIDLLGIDSSGNMVVVELKRDKLPRESLAQAIDYASDVAMWTIDKISEVCMASTEKSLEELFVEKFPDTEIETLNINSMQRILLVGFSIASSLERMIEWLSDGYGVNINAIILSYVKTINGEEILMRTSIISEELEQERVQKKKKFTIAMSDEPGNYSDDELKRKITSYLSKKNITNLRIRKVLIPACIEKAIVTREDLKQKYLEYDPEADESKVGYYLTPISGQLGMKKNDFLRQIIKYEYPKYGWEKDNFLIVEEYRDMVKQIIDELSD